MTLPVVTALPGERRHYVDGPDGQIHYRSHGAGPPVLLIHQAPWASIQYRHVLPRIAAAGLRAIAVDLPGHGMSDPSARPSIECYAEAAASVLRGLDAGPAAVLGHRGGGLVAVRLAAEHPDLVAALVLDNAPLFSAEERLARIGRFADCQQIVPDGSHFTDRWAWVREVGDPDWSDETVHISVLTYFAHGPWKEQGHAVIPHYDPAPDLPRAAMPALVVASRADPLFGSGRKIMNARPDWEYAELPGGPGMVLDRSDEWCGVVLPYLVERVGSVPARPSR